MDIVELGQAFRAARIVRRLTQQDAARHAGVSVATISRLERGELLELGVVKLISLFGLLGQELTVRPKGHGRTLDDIQRENSAAESVPALVAESWAKNYAEGVQASQRVRRTKAELSASSPVADAVNVLHPLKS